MKTDTMTAELAAAGVRIEETFDGSGNWVACSRRPLPDSLGGYWPSREAATSDAVCVLRSTHGFADRMGNAR